MCRSASPSDGRTGSIVGMKQGDGQPEVVSEGLPNDEAPPALTRDNRRGIIGTLAVLATLLTLVAFTTFAGYAVVIGLPAELLALACAVAVLAKTQRGSLSRRWAWALLVFTLIPVGLTTAYLVGVY